MAKRDKLEYEFLPAALEITETPPSPLGRFIIWLVFALIITFILWSYIGKVDEVAIARGKVLPDGRLKVIQPLEEGIVTAIYIKEGQRVKKGDLLIELDSSMKLADVDTITKSFKVAQLEKAILNAELEGKDIDKIVLQYSKDISMDEMKSQKDFKAARENEYAEKAERLKLVIKQNESELNGVQSNSERLEKKISELKDEEESLNYLYKAGSIAKRKWQDKQSELFSTEKENETLKSQERQIEDKIEESKKNLLSLDKERRTAILTQIVEKDKIIEDFSLKLTKAQKTYDLQKLVSPVDGIINGLAAYTIGGVVTPAQPVVTIVPDDTPIIIEAMAQNKDIGFIKLNQEVEIKMDTFPFQKYGTIIGRVTAISPDATEDEKVGLIYKIAIKPDRDYLMISGVKTRITPGMALTVEIKTDRRRIIEFFLSPILTGAQDSLKLR